LPKAFALKRRGFWLFKEGFYQAAVSRKTAGDIMREMRASEKAKGYDRIYTAGEKNAWLGWRERIPAYR